MWECQQIWGHCDCQRKHNGLEDHTSVEDSGIVPKSSRT